MAEASPVLANDTHFAVAKVVNCCRSKSTAARKAAIENRAAYLNKAGGLRLVQGQQSLTQTPKRTKKERKRTYQLDAIAAPLEDELEHRDTVLGVFEDIALAWETSGTVRKGGVSPETKVVLGDLKRIVELAPCRQAFIDVSREDLGEGGE